VTNKRKLRGIAILITLAFLLSLLPAGMASAGGSYDALQVPNVDDDTVDDLGTVLCKITAGSLSDGDAVIFRLPTDFEFRQLSDEDELDTTATFVYRIDIPDEYQGDTNGLKDADVEVEKLDDNEFKVVVTNLAYSDEWDSYLYLDLDNIYIDEDYEGDIELVASAPSGSGFPTGKVVVGRVGGGVLDISVIDAPTFSDDTDKETDPVTIRIEEDIKGALEEDDESLKFVLPSGFEWQDVDEDDDLKVIWGDEDLADKIEFDADEDELIIIVEDETDEATCFELTLGINVEDETKAKVGDVVAKIRGASDTKQAEAIVGTYGEYDVTIEVDGEPTTVFAGMLEQEIPDIVIKEAVEGSLTPGRTIILTLPSNAKWGAVDDSASDSSVDLNFVGFVGDDGRAIKYKVGDEESTDAAELTLEDLEVVLEPGVTGDLVIEVSGTQGLDAELKVAEVVAPVTATASEKSSVKVGLQGQVAGDITITESLAGAIKEDEDLIIDLPDGVKFTSVPEVEVTEGDLDIDESGVKRQADDNQLLIPIDGDSTEPSTIKISGIEYTVDRTVAEGDITVKIKGDAVIEVNDYEEIKDYYGTGNVEGEDGWVLIEDEEAFELDDGMIWPASTTAAKTVNAVVVTPAPGEVKGTAVLQIGSTTMKVNGVDVEMDVAPYLKNNRTYVSARFCAKALGVDDKNIVWDGATQTATIIAGAKVIQLKVGSNVMVINGANITMDTAPELVPPGRVMLPIGWLAWAFGAKADWDNETQTATLEL